MCFRDKIILVSGDFNNAHCYIDQAIDAAIAAHYDHRSQAPRVKKIPNAVVGSAAIVTIIFEHDVEGLVDQKAPYRKLDMIDWGAKPSDESMHHPQLLVIAFIKFEPGKGRTRRYFLSELSSISGKRKRNATKSKRNKQKRRVAR